MGTYLNLPGTAGSFASTPDSAALSITGDLDLRIKMAMDDWTPDAAFATAISKYESSSRDYLLQVAQTTGLIRFHRGNASTSSDNDDSDVAPTVANGAAIWIRATHRVSDQRVQFFSSPDGVIWTQLGLDETLGAITPGNGTRQVEIGSHSAGSSLLTGKVYYAEIRNGIDGTIVASPDFTNLPLSTTSFQDSQGNTWTINGTAAIGGTFTGRSSRTYRKLQLLAG